MPFETRELTTQGTLTKSDSANDLATVVEDNILLPEQIARNPTSSREVSDTISNISKQMAAFQEKLRSNQEKLDQTSDAVSANVVIQFPATQNLIRKTNDLQSRIRDHHRTKELTSLSEGLVHALGRYYAELIPLASGRYKPHDSSTLIAEIAHECSHMFEFMLIALPKIDIPFLHQLAGNIPLVSFVIKMLEILNDHYLIEQAEHLVGQLRNYSEQERNLLYQYVVTSTLLALATRIGTDNPKQWLPLLLQAFNSSVAAHNQYEPNGEPIDTLAENWAQSIISKFQQPGAFMPTHEQSTQAPSYERQHLSLALQVQKIFTDPNEQSSYQYLALPIINDFRDDFHRKLYEEVLKPYSKRATSSMFSSYFLWYNSEQLKQLKIYQSRFNHALTIIKDWNLDPQINNDLNLILQLNLIKTCLLANLNEMARLMMWHKPAIQLYLTESSSANTSCVREPLQELLNGDLTIVSLEGQLKAAQIREAAIVQVLSDTRKDLSDTKKELSHIRQEYTTASAKLTSAKLNDEKTKGMMGELKKRVQSQTAGKSSSLVVNGFFEPPSRGTDSASAADMQQPERSEKTLLH